MREKTCHILHIFFCVYMYLTVGWCNGDVIIVCSWWLLAKQFSRSDLLVVCYFWSPDVHPSVYPFVNCPQAPVVILASILFVVYYNGNHGL